MAFHMAAPRFNINASSNPSQSASTPLFPTTGPVSTFQLTSAVNKDPQAMLDYILALEAQNSDLKGLLHSTTNDIVRIAEGSFSKVKVEFGKTVTQLDRSLKTKGDEENHMKMRNMIGNIGRVVQVMEGELKEVQVKVNSAVAYSHVDRPQPHVVEETGEMRKERIVQESYDEAMEWTAEAGIQKKARTSMFQEGMDIQSTSKSHSGENIALEGISASRFNPLGSGK